MTNKVKRADLATPTSKQPLNLNASGSGGSAINSQVLVKSTPVSCFRVILLVLGPSVAASLTSAHTLKLSVADIPDNAKSANEGGREMRSATTLFLF